MTPVRKNIASLNASLYQLGLLEEPEFATEEHLTELVETYLSLLGSLVSAVHMTCFGGEPQNQAAAEKSVRLVTEALGLTPMVDGSFSGSVEELANQQFLWTSMLRNPILFARELQARCVPPTDRQLAELEKLARTIAMVGDIPGEHVLERTLPAYFGEQTLLDLQQRSPLTDREPPFRFHYVAGPIDNPEDGVGHWECSEAALLLEDEIEEMYELPVQRRIKELRELLSFQPTHISAGTALSHSLAESGDLQQAWLVCEQFYRYMTSLIPPGFQGWIDGDDAQFQVEALYSRWRLALELRKYKQALECLDQLGRIENETQPGYLYAFIHTLRGHRGKARSALKKAGEESSALAAEAFLYWLEGKNERFERLLGVVLLTTPDFCEILDRRALGKEVDVIEDASRWAIEALFNDVAGLRESCSAVADSPRYKGWAKRFQREACVTDEDELLAVAFNVVSSAA